MNQFLKLSLFIMPVFLLKASLVCASVYYISKTGSDSRSCAQAKSISTPKKTFASSLRCLTLPGDKLYIRGGTYTEPIMYTDLPASGTQAKPIVITRYPNEVVTIAPVSGCRGILMGNRGWITIDGINLEGRSLKNCPLDGAGNLIGTDGTAAQGLVFRNLDISNSPGSNGFAGDRMLLENIKVHGTGWRAQQIGYPPGSNGLYLSGITNSIVRDIVAYNNMCFGVRVFQSISDKPAANYNLIERVYSHTNGKGKGLNGTSKCPSGGGFVIGDTGNFLKNSVAYNNGRYGIWVYGSKHGTKNNKIYNNTVYKNPYGFVLSSNTSNSTLINNLSVGNTEENLLNEAVGTSLQSNKFTGAVTDCTVSATNFHLKSTSMCRDKGYYLGTVLSDFDKKRRPAASTHDIGAYEYY